MIALPPATSRLLWGYPALARRSKLCAVAGELASVVSYVLRARPACDATSPTLPEGPRSVTTELVASFEAKLTRWILLQRRAQHSGASRIPLCPPFGSLRGVSLDCSMEHARMPIRAKLEAGARLALAIFWV